MSRALDCPAEVFAQCVDSARFEHLPTQVIERVTALVEDHLGCALGALALPEARSILAVAEADVDAASARALGGPRTSLSSAVFCNSQLSNLLDFDDMHDYFLPYHPGCLIIPAALAVAESVGASGREFLTAVAVAYEVVMRVGRAMGDGLWKHPPASAALDELAAAIAAAKLYRLSAQQVRALFSIIAMDEGGFSPHRGKNELAFELGSLKGNFGSRAQIGLWAAMKARAGLTGRSPGMLEWNLAEWYRMGLLAGNFERLTAGLGADYLSLEMSLKPAPSCRMTHIPITAAWNALGGRTLDAPHVARIRVLGVPRLQHTTCSDMIDAQFSVPCSLALAVSGIEPGPQWFTGGAFKSPRILELAAKVTQELDPAAERTEIMDGRATCLIEIHLKDGRVLEGECRSVKGGPDNPLTESERLAKFAANTAHLHDANGARLAIRRLAQGGSIAELQAALTDCAESACTPW